jgi:hypothetical protein
VNLFIIGAENIKWFENVNEFGEAKEDTLNVMDVEFSNEVELHV